MSRARGAGKRGGLHSDRRGTRGGISTRAGNARSIAAPQGCATPAARQRPANGRSEGKHGRDPTASSLGKPLGWSPILRCGPGGAARYLIAHASSRCARTSHARSAVVAARMGAHRVAAQSTLRSAGVGPQRAPRHISVSPLHLTDSDPHPPGAHARNDAHRRVGWPGTGQLRFPPLFRLTRSPACNVAARAADDAQAPAR